MATFGVVVRRVWNGPFYIGKLEQPATVGDVLLKVLETLWRAFLVLIALSLLFLFLTLAWYGVLSPTLFPPLSKSITISATYDAGIAPIVYLGPKPSKPFRCTKDYPIKIEFHNTSRTTVRSVAFDISANAQSHSTNLAQFPSYFTSDVVMAPGTGWIQCYNVLVQTGYDLASLEYQGVVVSASE